MKRENDEARANQKAQTNIHRLGKTLTVLCRIARAVLWMLTALCILCAIVSLMKIEWVDQLDGLMQQNVLYQGLREAAGIEEMEPGYVSAIGWAVSAISFGALALYTRGFQRLLGALIESERPFTRETARQIRRKSYTVLLTVLYNPIAGVLIFLIAMLFSYLVDYGAMIQEKADETNRIQEEMIVSFAEITENKSGQTGQHVRRVSVYARVIARQMGLPEERVETLRLASTMHDIGKLLIPAEILEKPGKLTDEEYAVIQRHTTYGGQLLENVEGDVIGTARTVALEHHERPDGRGYPIGKTEISLEGRIVAVADVYDALTSRRSYKEAWAEDRAYQEILRGSGTQFDPAVVAAFEQGYDEIREIRERYRDEG